jgi:hypothetical protein
MNIDFLFNGASKREYEDRITFLEQQIERLQYNGIAQATDLGKDISALNQSLQTANEETLKLSAALKSAEEENELLLLQLHQVQEELEAVFLRDQETSKALEQSNAEQQRLAAEFGALRQQLDAAQQELQNLRSAHDQLNARQREIEQQLDQAINEKNQLEQSRSAIQQQLDQAISEKNQIEQSRTVTQQQLTDAEQENELLLLQLHQVQEELEHYFLEHQKEVQEKELMTERWRRLEKRMPHYLDFEGITITAVDAVSKSPKLSWRATGITINGTVVPEIIFDTFLHAGSPGIRFGETDQVILVPAAVNLGDQNAMTSFRKMSPDQWYTANAIVNLVESYLKDTKSFVGAPQGFDPVFWRQAMLPLAAEIHRLPPVFRFNRISLKRELIHPDYEHIWMVLTDASFGRYQWPKFEMRIGAANLLPQGFSVNPKLEFPLIDGKEKPFDSWYEESKDHIGDKFEIRFDLARKVFDANVWIKLSVEDQSLMLSFISALPQMLERMQGQRVVIARDWREWLTLANGMVDTLRLRLARPKAAAPSMTDAKSSPAATTPSTKSPASAMETPKNVPQGNAAQTLVQQEKTGSRTVQKAPARKKATAKVTQSTGDKPPVKSSTAAASPAARQPGAKSGVKSGTKLQSSEKMAQTKLFDTKQADSNRIASKSSAKPQATKPNAVSTKQPSPATRSRSTKAAASGKAQAVTESDSVQPASVKRTARSRSNDSI